MSREPLVDRVESILLHLAHSAQDWETVTWLAAVGDCFDGGDFDTADFGNLHWRITALRDRGVPTERLIEACQAVLDSPRTRERNRAFHCGRLRAFETPVLAVPR